MFNGLWQFYRLCICVLFLLLKVSFTEQKKNCKHVASCLIEQEQICLLNVCRNKTDLQPSHRITAQQAEQVVTGSTDWAQSWCVCVCVCVWSLSDHFTFLKGAVQHFCEAFLSCSAEMSQVESGENSRSNIIIKQLHRLPADSRRLFHLKPLLKEQHMKIFCMLAFS